MIRIIACPVRRHACRQAVAATMLVLSPLLAAQTAAPTAPVPTTGRPTPQPPRTVSPADAEKARNAYLAGAKLLARADLAGAQTEFERAAKLDPNSVDYTIAARLALEHRVTELVQEAGKARMLGQNTAADTLLAQARTLDPDNSIVRQHAASLLQAHDAGFEPVLEGALAPGNGADAGSPDPQTPVFAGMIRLRPKEQRQSFHLRGDLETVVRQVFGAFGIQASFDSSVDPANTPQGVRFDLENTTFAEAVPILLSMGRLFFTPLSPTSALLAVDTTANRGRLEHLYQETIYTPGLSPQQMGEVTNVIRQVFDVKQISMQNNAGNITLRAPAGTLDALNRTLRDLLEGVPEINLELRLFSVDATRTRAFGPTIPQQFGVYNVASAAQSLVTANQSAVDQAISSGLLKLTGNSTTDLLTEALFLVQSGIASSSLLTDTIGFFGKGLALTGVTSSGGAGLTLALNSSDTRALDDLQVRASNRQTATFRAGTRYPITTSTYSTGLAGTNAAALAGATINGVSVSSLVSQYLGSSAAGTTIPQIQYEDLGITLKATPNVENTGTISMHLDLKIESLTGAAINNIPVLTSRQFASDVTVADGQTALLLSSLSSTESAAVSGIPGLSELPGFQTVSADNTRERDKSELVLLLTPRIVRQRANLTVGPLIPVSPAGGSSD